MRKKNAPKKQPPTLHTLIIGDVCAAWEKMYWDIDVFGDLQRSCPEEDAPLAYAALNACISSWSLENWAKSAWKRQRRIEGKSISNDEFYKKLITKIPYQGLCVDVANTTKHGEFRECRWENGELKLKYDDASEDTPPGFSVQTLHEGKISYLYNDLHDFPHLWWNFLFEIDLVSSRDMPTPDWFRHKISRLFGQSRNQCR